MASITLDLAAVRGYLRTAQPLDGEAIVNDGVVRQQPGARELVRLALELRANRRTRRTLDAVGRWVGAAPAVQPGWYRRLCAQLYSLYRTVLLLALPAGGHGHQHVPAGHIPRAQRRVLRPAGMVPPAVPSLADRAQAAVQQRWAAMRDQDVVLWVDNWYLRRFATDPLTPDLSLNLTAMGVLLLAGPRDTRSTRVLEYPGHMTPSSLVGVLDTTAYQIVVALDRLTTAVETVVEADLEYGDIRVPLDVVRTQVRSVQWQPLALSESRVSDNVGLLEVAAAAVEVQKQTRRVLPLLVDEKIHYSLCKRLYAQRWQAWDMAGLLHRVPLVYGVWHGYKQLVQLVWRQCFPILVLLDPPSEPVAGQEVRCHRKLAYIERMFAALLLAGQALRPRLVSGLTQIGAVFRDGVPSIREVECFEHSVLLGLHHLLCFWLPAVFSVGHKVRRCTWEGRPGGTVRGDTAKLVLQQCLGLMMQLQADWECKEEYTRSLSVALLSWQPWHSSLPGCAFVEESTEAMLSTASRQMSRQRSLSGFQAAFDMFVTLPLPSGDPHDLKVGFKWKLVGVYRRRLRRLVDSTARVIELTAVWDASNNATWVPGKSSTRVPEPPVDLGQDEVTRVLKGALVTLMNPGTLEAPVMDWLRDNVEPVTGDALRVRRLVYARVQSWRTERADRLKRVRPPQAAGRVAKMRASAPSVPLDTASDILDEEYSVPSVSGPSEGYESDGSDLETPATASSSGSSSSDDSEYI